MKYMYFFFLWIPFLCGATRVQVIDPHLSPWKGIGILVSKTYGNMYSTCTATLIYKNVALTASHCVDHMSRENMKFYNSEKLYSLIETYVTFPKSTIHDDLALIFLQNSYTYHMKLGIFSDSIGVAATHIMTAGYPSDKKFFTLWSEECILKGESKNILYHNCISVPGTSGSAIWKDGIIYGVNIGIVKNRRYINNIAIKINKYIYDVIIEKINGVVIHQR